MSILNWIKIFNDLRRKGIKIVHVSFLEAVSGLSPKSLSVALWRLERRGLVERVGRGWYCIDCCETWEIIRVVFPSAYLTLEWALHYHDILDQRVTTITLAWLGKTKTVKVGERTYELHRISRKLYFGFNDKMIAEPEKALLDTLYYRGKLPPELNLDLLDKNRLAKYSEKYPPRVRRKLKTLIP